MLLSLMLIHLKLSHFDPHCKEFKMKLKNLIYKSILNPSFRKYLNLLPNIFSSLILSNNGSLNRKKRENRTWAITLLRTGTDRWTKPEGQSVFQYRMDTRSKTQSRHFSSKIDIIFSWEMKSKFNDWLKN